MKLEVQVRRDMLSRTKPQTFDYNPSVENTFHLYDGSETQFGDGLVSVHLSRGFLITHLWLSCLVQVKIDGVVLGEARPAAIFQSPSDIPTLAHFTEFVSVERNRKYGGWWTVCFRVTG